ncbi:hypothetical protein [Glaciihabitans sp. dw_435]|uniref:hypothetical protein n=1 Tax=Glaciihabitans sp. dw_435 TaxID=2720081 RepID=UPI001BD2482D|nr:hypothetical protein [Glaciihabitans sp. dw_435]
MIWSRKTVAELDFPIAVGAYSDLPGFQGRQLVASAKFAGFGDVFVRGDDSATDYFYAQQINVSQADATEQGSWEAECVLYPVDPALTPAAAKKLVLSGVADAPRAIGTVFFTSGVERARGIQATLDAARSTTEATEPWLRDPNYAGDYATAMWGHDVSGRYGDFPVKILDREFPPYLPLFSALRRPEGWPRALTFLAGPLATPAPSLDGPAATVLVYEVLAGENDSTASAAIMRGEREPVCELLVGSRDLIREVSHD